MLQTNKKIKIFLVKIFFSAFTCYYTRILKIQDEQNNSSTDERSLSTLYSFEILNFLKI